MIIDPDKIRDDWKLYFENLYTPKKTGFDEEFKNYVEMSMKDMNNKSKLNISENILSQPITTKEVEIVIKGLKCRKAPGIDLITTECFRYGGVKSIKCLTMLYNLICKFECIPKQFKKGIIVPVPKGNKDKCNKDNYRGITLLPVISKVFEKCIIIRVERWARKHNIINEQQGAAQLNCSSLNVSWLVQEAIAKNVEIDKNIYICLLDTKKAYDSVWQDGLFYTLYNEGINGKTWRILQQFYSGFTCYVKINNTLSDGFEALQGIHQGAPCSMFMFEIFTTKLLEQLSSCMFAIDLYGKKICSPAYADDLTVIALSKEGLQSMLSLVNKYSIKWRFEFNPSKCKTMIFSGKYNCKDKCEFKLGKTFINESKCEIMLGTVLTNSKTEEIRCFDSRIENCKKIVYAAQAIGSHVVPVTPVIASKLYWDVCVPKLC